MPWLGGRSPLGSEAAPPAYFSPPTAINKAGMQGAPKKKHKVAFSGIAIFWPILLCVILTPLARHQQPCMTPTTITYWQVAGAIVSPNGGLNAAPSPPHKQNSEHTRQKEVNSTG
jgi:hypothetical protein